MSETGFGESTLEVAVARFLVGFGLNDVDAGALTAVKALLKDQLACQIGAARLPWSQDVRSFLRKPRPGSSSVIAESTRMDAADAAYINASYGHGFEYDDVASNGHPGCSVVPTAIALGEEIGATLGQVVEAVVAGYEVYARIGRLAAPDLVNAGWHAHAVLGNFGSAAVAARIHGLDAERALHTLAIALSHASGTTEYTASGGSIKRVHAGIAARNGIESVGLARAGITGPLRYLTGKKGFFQTFIRRPAVDSDASAAFDAGTRLRINDAWLKAYCCCGAHHGYIEAMESVQHRAAEIAAVDASVQTMTAALGDNPQAQLHGPRNIEELQFSLALQMALAALGKGNGNATHRAFLEGKLSIPEDSDVVQFARRIRVQRSPELDRRYPYNFVAEVVVHYNDGTTQKIFVESAKGMPGNPFTPQEHRRKLDELTHEIVGVERAEKLFDMIDQLDPGRPVTDLTALLRLD
ncbi:2-methylcitrate dehydratase PrpD [Caballeronia arationis]|uniref:2-methylcitrate dehydratase PrpD n=1 Tax=Caballeronia arationis TaxID=1777142 RepID=A0A7Z7N0Q5_9BURK|nr:2-methylcitrate dehydratase PrpD [Caballeronia arationis]